MNIKPLVQKRRDTLQKDYDKDDAEIEYNYDANLMKSRMQSNRLLRIEELDWVLKLLEEKKQND